MATIGPLKKLGTIWWFEFFDVESTNLAAIETRLISEMDRFEAAYSRFRADSLLSQLNATGHLDGISSEFYDLLSIAQTAYVDTRGIFNIAVGKRLEQSGYDAQYSFKAEAELPEVPSLPNVLHFDKHTATLTAGAHIDLGGFGKGYLIDRLADLLKAEGLSQQFLINGGGDMYATDHGGEPIAINLADPADPGRLVGSLSLTHVGFAASSPHLRQWQSGGATHTHLVGTEKAAGVFIVAPTTTGADIWSTALSIDQTLTPPPTVTWWYFGEDKKLHSGQN